MQSISLAFQIAQNAIVADMSQRFFGLRNFGETAMAYTFLSTVCCHDSFGRHNGKMDQRGWIPTEDVQPLRVLFE
jgi:hypothetical protein